MRDYFAYAPEVRMELDPKALSDDGYIIDQRRTESISFGGCPSSKNGCGWIAAYNFLKALDRTPTRRCCSAGWSEPCCPAESWG